MRQCFHPSVHICSVVITSCRRFELDFVLVVFYSARSSIFLHFASRFRPSVLLVVLAGSLSSHPRTLRPEDFNQAIGVGQEFG